VQLTGKMLYQRKV